MKNDGGLVRIRAIRPSETLTSARRAGVAVIHQLPPTSTSSSKFANRIGGGFGCSHQN